MALIKFDKKKVPKQLVVFSANENAHVSMIFRIQELDKKEYILEFTIGIYFLLVFMNKIIA
jgi:hypothetical protein